MVEAIHTDFPLGQMAFALQQHMAPRVLQASGASSPPINVNKSILAGCKYSVAMTRVYAMRNYIALDKQHEDANTDLFVDDTSMHASGETCQEVRDILVPAMRNFQIRVKKLKLRLSPKAAIVTSSMNLARTLNKELAQSGLRFVISQHSRDLGFEIAQKQIVSRQTFRDNHPAELQ